MERLKDILYDLSDILITVGIVAIIFFVVTWKLNDVIPTSETLLNSPTPTETTETVRSTQGDTETATEQYAGTPRDQVDIISNLTPLTSSTEQAETMANDSLPTNEEDVSSVDISEETETVSSTNEDKRTSQFIIPYGATIKSIASDLKKSNLIDNEDDFIQKVIDRDDGGKILAGTFKLSNTMTNDDIIDTLIGK